MNGARGVDFAWRPVFLDTVESTNEEAARMAREGAPAGTLVCARRQTAGRGRRGRTWASPAGNLYASLVLRPDCAPAAAPQLSFVAALAAADTIRPRLPTPAALRLKWPNDLLIGGRKVAGLLLETESTEARRLDWLIVGMGINVVSFPEDVDATATCLTAEGAAAATPADLLDSFMAIFPGWAARWQREGFAPIRQAWLDSAAGLGSAISARLSNETLRGDFVGLDEDGALMLALPDGSRRKIAAGDVFFAPRA